MTTDGHPTYLRQQIRINLREHLPRITRPRNNLPPRWRVLNAETNIRWNVGTVFGVKVFAYLAFFYDVAVVVIIIKDDAIQDRRSPENMASSCVIIPLTTFSAASRYCRRLAISMRSLPNDDRYWTNLWCRSFMTNNRCWRASKRSSQSTYTIAR